MLWQAPANVVAFNARNETLGSPERYRAATLAETYYLSRQYDSLADWYDRSKKLRERKPRIIVPLYREAIDTLERFVWGGHRHPKVSIPPTQTDDKDQVADEVGPRLKTDAAQKLSTFVQAMITQGRLDRTMRELSRVALVTTSGAAILGTRGGYLTAHVEPGKHCTPTWDKDNPRRLSKLEILYQHEREERDSYGNWHRH